MQGSGPIRLVLFQSGFKLYIFWVSGSAASQNQRFSASRFRTFPGLAVDVKNEPILGFEAGSPERAELQKVVLLQARF